MKGIEGQPLVFRRLWPSERGEVIEHFLRLDPEDRYLRFGGVVRDQAIREYISSKHWTRSLLVGCIVGAPCGLWASLRSFARASRRAPKSR